MKRPTIDTISEETFDETIQKYISWASEWDGALPADTFFGVWVDLQRQKKPLALKARVIEGNLELQAPPESSIRVEDSSELIINLEAVG